MGTGQHKMNCARHDLFSLLLVATKNFAQKEETNV